MQSNFKTIDKISIFLLFLIPILLITGPFLPDLSIIIISLLFIYKTFKRKNLILFKNKYFLIFLSFCILITINSFFSDDIKLSLLSSAFYFRFGIFSLAIYVILKEDLKILFILKNIFLIIIFVLFFDTVYQFFFGKNLIGFEYTNPQNFRITSFFGEDEVLGSYISRFFPFILSLVLFHQYKKNKVKLGFLMPILIIISFVIVFLSGERTAFVLLLISSFLIFITCKSLRKPFLIASVFLTFIISILITLNPSVKNRMYDSVIKQLGLHSDSERIILFSETYESHYKIALNMFKEKPIVGHGVKIFRVYCQKPENFVSTNGCTTHPHNTYMQFLAETGILGFIYLLSFFFFISYLILKKIYKNIFNKNNNLTEHMTCILIFYFITLFPLIPSGNFFNNWLSIIYYLPSGLLIYFCKEKLVKNEL